MCPADLISSYFILFHLISSYFILFHVAFVCRPGARNNHRTTFEKSLKQRIQQPILRHSEALRVPRKQDSGKDRSQVCSVARVRCGSAVGVPWWVKSQKSQVRHALAKTCAACRGLRCCDVDSLGLSKSHMCVTACNSNKNYHTALPYALLRFLLSNICMIFVYL